MKLSKIVGGWFDRHPNDPVPLYELEIWESKIARIEGTNTVLLKALEQALIHVQLLGSGQKPVNSNAEMCTLLGDALTKTEVT